MTTRRILKNSAKQRVFLEVLSLYAKGYNQSQIVDKVHISQPVVSRMISKIHDDSLAKLPYYLTSQIPWEIERSLITYNEVEVKAWELADHADPRIRQLGLNLVMQCTSDRQSLLSTLHGTNEAIQTIRAAEIARRANEISELRENIIKSTPPELQLQILH